MTVLVLFLLGACKNEESKQPEPQPEPVPDPGLTIAEEIITVDAAGGMVELPYLVTNPVNGAVITVTSDMDWVSGFFSPGSTVFRIDLYSDQQPEDYTKITMPEGVFTREDIVVTSFYGKVNADGQGCIHDDFGQELAGHDSPVGEAENHVDQGRGNQKQGKNVPQVVDDFVQPIVVKSELVVGDQVHAYFQEDGIGEYCQCFFYRIFFPFR